MSTLYIEIDGKPVKTTDALWVHYAPCGCMCGLSHVNHCDKDLLTEADAQLTFTNTSTRREADRDAELGFRVQLVTFADYRDGKFGSLVADCPHTPKFGVVKTPVPDGYAWARDQWNRRMKVRHLLPAESIGDYKWRGSTICGQELPRVTWRDDEMMRYETYECTRCVAKAFAVTGTAAEAVAP